MLFIISDNAACWMGDDIEGSRISEVIAVVKRILLVLELRKWFFHTINKAALIGKGMILIAP